VPFSTSAAPHSTSGPRLASAPWSLRSTASFDAGDVAGSSLVYRVARAINYSPSTATRCATAAIRRYRARASPTSRCALLRLRKARKDLGLLSAPPHSCCRDHLDECRRLSARPWSPTIVDNGLASAFAGSGLRVDHAQLAAFLTHVHRATSALPRPSSNSPTSRRSRIASTSPAGHDSLPSSPSSPRPFRLDPPEDRGR